MFRPAFLAIPLAVLACTSAGIAQPVDQSAKPACDRGPSPFPDGLGFG